MLTALVTQQVYRHIQTFLIFVRPCVLKYSGPTKSTPVLENEVASLTQSRGNGGGAGERCGLPLYLLHNTHWCTTLLTRFLPFTIQYLVLISVRVSFTPLCRTFSWACLVISTARWVCLLRKIGWLVAYCRSLLVSLLPHLKIPFLS